jgi:alkylhydroperoxidase family enzyme
MGAGIVIGRGSDCNSGPRRGARATSARSEGARPGSSDDLSGPDGRAFADARLEWRRAYDAARLPERDVAWIRLIAEHDAEGLLEKVYAAGRGRAGGVAEIIKVMSLDAPSLDASMRLYVALMKSPNALEPARREMLATVVSNVNECFY